MGELLKIINYYNTVHVSSGLDFAKKITPLPGTINFQNTPPNERFVEVSELKEKVTLFLTASGKFQKELKLDTASVFTHSELLQLAELFNLNIENLGHALNYYYCYKIGIDKRYTRAFIILSKFDFGTFAAVYFPGGNNDFDDDLPYIWRIAEVELSKEFLRRISW